jgi:transcriptional regulator with XRE-family HTH domain
MPEPLWKIRQRKGLRVNQLAAKSGVPAISIQEYESGQAIRSADLPKLAKALYVEEWDIELKSVPRPRPSKRKPPASRQPQRETADRERPRRKPPDQERSQPAKPAHQPKPKAPARPSQIAHLLAMTTSRFGKDQAALEKEVGKPLETLTKKEASELLKHYQDLVVAARASPTPTAGTPGLKRKRAYLPESVDGFELNYLTTQQEEQALLHWTLFDGQELRGRVVGFGPYNITIRDEDTDEEVTLQKLAVAYYRRIAPAPAAEPKGGGAP